MSELLSLTLVAALPLLVLATVSLFLPGPAGPWTPARLGVVVAAVAAAVMGEVALLGGSPASAAFAATVLAGSVLAWAPAVRGWATRGVATWALGIDAGVLFLAYVGLWTVTSGLAVPDLLASLILWVLELFVLVLGAGYAFELVDVLGRRRWVREVDLDAADPSYRPFVSLHVPAHNEPPDMVIATLTALLELDYEDFEILMVDDNTEDPALWAPVEEFCNRHDRIRFFHLQDWPGYKSGALNFALGETDPRAEVVGVIDADYVVRPDFLARCAPLFATAGVSFVQTPQDYRDWEQSAYFRRLYHAYGYFFDVSQRSRSEVDGAIFGGTMGLIRRADLEAVGGWDEWCITEDAELSLRLLKRGGSGLHVTESFGHGVMPLTFEALKRQRFRWCFGGVQILRTHWRDLLPWRRGEGNRLAPAQRWAYLVGGLQWFGDLAALMFTGFLLLGAANLLTGDGLVVRRLSGLVVLCLLTLLVLGALRSVALLRRVRGTTWSEALGAFGIWLALSWAVALGAFRGLVSREGAFLRTPKVRGDLSWRDAIRGNRAELALATVSLAVAALTLSVGGFAALAVGILLVVQGTGYAMAPVNSLAAIRADLPSDLRRRRRDMLPSWTRVSPPPRAVWWPVVAVGVGGLIFVALAAPAGGPLAQLPDTVERAVRPDKATATERSTRPSPTPSSRPARPSGTTAAVTPVRASTAPVPPRAASTAAQPTTAGQPTAQPSQAATGQPTQATGQPSTQPTQAATGQPSSQPTQAATPTSKPTQAASGKPTSKPTQAGAGKPTSAPSGKPTGKP